jgi:hypothetical protein
MGLQSRALRKWVPGVTIKNPTPIPIATPTPIENIFHKVLTVAVLNCARPPLPQLMTYSLPGLTTIAFRPAATTFFTNSFGSALITSNVL